MVDASYIAYTESGTHPEDEVDLFIFVKKESVAYPRDGRYNDIWYYDKHHNLISIIMKDFKHTWNGKFTDLVGYIMRNTSESILEIIDALQPFFETHKLDNDKQVFFYEQDFYMLSNFSAFTLNWKGIRFDTSEAAYHWEKFPDYPMTQEAIINAKSAHESYKTANEQKAFRRKDWNEVKDDIMLNILRAKVQQHEYVCMKLISIGSREMIEDSHRDVYWGWGPDRNGLNKLGKLWKRIQLELLLGELKVIWI